jgi:ribosomal protein L12E/L44/L45/RPP1/RPP2
MAPHHSPSGTAVGVEAEEERISKLLSELEGKDIAEVRVHAGMATWDPRA